VSDTTPRITRRETLQLTGAGALSAALGLQAGPVRAGAARAAPPPAGNASAQLVLSQRRWRADDVGGTAGPIVEDAARRFGPGTAHLLVLLPAADVPRAPVRQSRVVAALAELATRSGVWLAGAACMESEGTNAVLGFLIAPDGATRLAIPKVTPDMAEGFSDAAAGLGRAGSFAVAGTPFGVVGLLPGEDVLMPGLVRGLMYAGAELLLAPLGAVPPGTEPALADLPVCIGYENWCAVAITARGAHATYGDHTLDTVVAAAGTAEAAVHFEPGFVRQARAKISPDIYDNFPLWLRDDLFGRIFTAQAAARPAGPAPTTREGWRTEADRRMARQAERKTPADKLLDSYLAFVVQPATMVTLPAEGRREALTQNIDTALRQVGPLVMAPNAKLALFPEFCFSGAAYRTVPDMLSAAVTLPGPEVARLQQWARDNTIYAAAQFLETDPAFPGRAFNTAVIIDDAGEVILKHRKLQCVDIFGALPDTTPGSVFDQYVEQNGIESLYRIVDTPLGKIGVAICFEIVFPEVIRSMANEGAEVILHLTAEGYGSLRPAWHALRRKRAFENQVYLLCSNKGYEQAQREAWVSYGESALVDFRGRVRDRLGGNGPGVLIAPVELGSLRAARRDVRLNTLIWDEPGAYAAAYQRGLGIANNGWTGDPQQSPYNRVGERIPALADVQDRFYAAGTYRRPG